MSYFYLHLSTSTIKSISVLSFLTWSRFATVIIGTYWSLSICDIRYMSLARFSLLEEKKWGHHRHNFFWSLMNLRQKLSIAQQKTDSCSKLYFQCFHMIPSPFTYHIHLFCLTETMKIAFCPHFTLQYQQLLVQAALYPHKHVTLKHLLLQMTTDCKWWCRSTRIRNCSVYLK